MLSTFRGYRFKSMKVVMVNLPEQKNLNQSPLFINNIYNHSYLFYENMLWIKGLKMGIADKTKFGYKHQT